MSDLNLKLFRKGKVREVYDLENYLLIVVSDRISAFDVIMDDLVKDKGRVLTAVSKFWFDNTGSIIPNHMVSCDVNEFPAECSAYKAELEGRSMLVKKCNPLPVEFVVRGYLAGSGWKEYQKFGTVCGIEIPAGLQEYSKLPEPIFTPATKAETGHDENINYERYTEILGKDKADYLRDKAIALYEYGRNYMDERGIILADTKFEFGELPGGELILIDEALTPDSSRFWLKEFYAPGKEQMNFDKQVLRDYLETLDWNKMPPPPVLPAEIINKTFDKYKEAYKRITGIDWA